MRSSLRLLFRGRQVPSCSSPSSSSPRQQQITKMASVTGATATLSLATYHSTVTVRPPRPAEFPGLGPEAHHVKNRHGKTVKFQNPHTSWGPPTPLGLLSLFTFVLCRLFTPSTLSFSFLERRKKKQGSGALANDADRAGSWQRA